MSIANDTAAGSYVHRRMLHDQLANVGGAAIAGARLFATAGKVRVYDVQVHSAVYMWSQ